MFLDPLPRRAYDVVVIDAPWHFRLWSEITGAKKAAQSQYTVMTLDAIKALPVRELLKPDAIVLEWATAPLLPAAIEVMAAWGVTYKSNLVWRKMAHNNKVRPGLGYWARSIHEHILIGTVGKPRALRLPSSLIDGIRREHSRKPDEFYRALVDATPNLRRADLFAREYHLGFEAWGDELNKFNSESAAVSTTADEKVGTLDGADLSNTVDLENSNDV
jgi:N6-adenosine-specific RNA methylase IME4